MEKNTTYSMLYRLIESEKSPHTFLNDIISTLQHNFKGTLWNIGVTIESTSNIIFTKKDKEFENFLDKALIVFDKDKKLFTKEKIPSGYKWILILPMMHKNSKLGVMMCLGSGKNYKLIEGVASEAAFIVQQFQLQRKLIKDTILMNTINIASQSTAVSKDILPLIKILLPSVIKYLDAEGVKVYMWEGDECSYYDESGNKNSVSSEINNSIVMEVMNTGRSLMLKEAYKLENFNPEIDSIYNNKNVRNLIISPIKVADKVKGVLLAENNSEYKVFVGSELVLIKSICGEIGATLERLNLYFDIHKLFLSSVEALTSAIECKDPYTYGHSKRVTLYSLLIGNELGLESEEIEKLRLAALLHDIGKIAIPESILLKTEKLTDEEWSSLRQHPVKGVKILEPIKEFIPILPIIKYHHERYDGKGYPEGLKSEDIPQMSSIIAVADAFDAMTSQRIYRAALTEAEAIDEINRCKGTQFDIKIADTFLKAYRENSSETTYENIDM